MKLIDVLTRLFLYSNIVIKHVKGCADSQHYLYKGQVIDILFQEGCTYHDREVVNVYVNKSTLIIVIE